MENMEKESSSLGGGRESSLNSTIGEYWQQKYRRESAKSWNLFYRRNETRFFKDRHWISHEFPELYQPEIKTVLEVGCGVGNFAFPLAEDNPDLTIFACDFAESAIELFKKDQRYNSGKLIPFVADLTIDTLTRTIPPSSIDVVTCIFVLSAIPPEKFLQVIVNIKSILKPGGIVLLRDYSIDDATQKRFKDDRKLSEVLFVRQDGTLTYYFGKEELEGMFRNLGFSVEMCELVHSKTTNIKKDIDVDRLFIKAKFKLI